MRAPSTSRSRSVVALGVFVVLAAGLAVGVSSCGGDEEVGYPEISVKEPTAEAMGQGATLSGTVSWKGDAPKNGTLSMVADPYCKDAGEGLKAERVVVDGNGGLRDVLIHVTEGLEDYTFDWVREAALIDQVNCVYVPHVVAIRAYQPLTFRNSDLTTHNVNTRASAQGFNKTTTSKGSEFTWQFKKPELGLRTKCDVHPWMNAYIHVLDHPYFAVTDAAGKWTFPRALPPGTYTIEALHPTEGKKTAKVTIEAGKAASALDFQFNE